MQVQPLRQMVLFTPPRLAEERKAYWRAGPGQRATASGLGRLGANPVSEVLDTVKTGVIDFVETFTGQRSQRQLQEKTLELQRLQTQQKMAAGDFWAKAVPWLAVGGAAAVGLLAFATRK